MNIKKNYKQGAIEETFQRFIGIHHCLDTEMARKTFFSGAFTLFFFQESIFKSGGKPEDVAPLFEELMEWSEGQRNSNESGGQR